MKVISWVFVMLACFVVGFCALMALCIALSARLVFDFISWVLGGVCKGCAALIDLCERGIEG